MNWKKFKEEKPSEGEEVLAYHPSWIDEDFNPRGIRIGFWNGGDDFKSAHWWDYQDCYITISHCDCDDKDAERAMAFLKEAYPFNEETEVFIRKRYNMSIDVDPEEN